MGGISLWVRAEWRRRWAVLVALAVLVAIAGGVATALYAGAKRADTALVRFREQTAPYNLEAWVNLGAEKPASVAELEELLEAQRAAVAEVGGLDGVESVRVESWWGISAFPEYDEPGTVSAFATGTSATYGSRHTPIVLDGALPLPDDPDAVVVGEHATDVLGWKVGDRLTFGTVSPDGLFDWFSNDATFGSRDALDGPVIEVEVVAVIRDEADLADDRFPSILFPEGFARAHGDEIAHVEPIAMIRADPNRIDDVADRIEAILGPVGMQVDGAAATRLRRGRGRADGRRRSHNALDRHGRRGDCRALRRGPGRRSTARCRRGRGQNPRCTRNHDGWTGGGQVADAGTGRVDRGGGGADRGVVTEWPVSERVGAAGRARSRSAFRHQRGRRRRRDDARRDADPHGRDGVDRITPPTSVHGSPRGALATPFRPPCRRPRRFLRG